MEINKKWGGFLSKKNVIKLILAVLSALIAAAQTLEEKEDGSEYNRYNPYDDNMNWETEDFPDGRPSVLLSRKLLFCF